MYLKAEITETGITCVGHNTMPELCTALSVLISELYENLPAGSRDVFKFCIRKALEDDVLFTMADKEKKKEALNKFDFDSIFDSLKGLGLKDD